MLYRQYKFKFYLNMSHAIYIDGKRGQSHPHTWEIAINTVKLKDSFVEFNKIEECMEEYLSRYQDKLINEIEPFTTLNPILENCCEYFKDQIMNILDEQGWMLLLIEVSESPTKSFLINLLDEAYLSQVHSSDAFIDTMLDNIMKS